MAPYHYERATTYNEIRILTLQPSGHEDDEIHCKLDIVPRELAPAYTALSYAWGEDEPHAVEAILAELDTPGPDRSGQNPSQQSPVKQEVLTIKINDSHFEVSRTLDAAIRRLRRGKEPRKVWIDAICVIQDNGNEFYVEDKNAQVYSMDKTYKNASEVYVWLGLARPEESSSLAMEAINTLGSQLDGFSTPKDAPIAPLDLDPISGRQPHEYMEAILKLVKNRKWFHRRWVIQEICLAPPSTIILCGRDEAPYWKLFLLQLHPKVLELVLETALRRPDLQDSSFGEPSIGLTRQYFLAEKREPAKWSETAFAATSGSNAAVKFPADCPMLISEGYRIGAIKQLATEDLEQWEDDLTKVREALKKALDWTRKLSAARTDRYPDPIDAFWRTIITNRGVAAQKPAEVVEGVQFRHWWDLLVLRDMTKFTPQGKLLAWKFQSLFLQRWPFRDFFVTESGYVGMCGHARAYDDVVCLLRGSQVPFLLRPSKVEKNRYWVVGECYVHDIMEGSLWRNPEDWMEKETFHIV